MSSSGVPTSQGLRLPSQLESVREARDFVARIGAEAGMRPDRLFDLKVTVSEACANAVEHISDDSREFEVKLFRYAERLTVLVRSPESFSLTKERLPEREEHRGFGLPFMAMLADQLSIRRTPEGGTLVILTFYLSNDAPQEPLLGHDAFHAITDAFFALDRSWRVTFANERAAAYFHLPPDQLIGRDLNQALNGQLPAEVTDRYKEAMEEGNTDAFEAFIPTLGAWVESRIYPSPEGIAVYFTDISERKRMEAELRRSEELAKSLGEIHLLLTSTADRDALLRRGLSEAANALGADWGAVVVPAESAWVMRFVHGAPEPVSLEEIRERCLRLAARVDPSTDGIITVRDGAGAVRSDLNENPTQTGVLLGVVLRAFGDTVGLLCLGFLTETDLSKPTMSFGRDLSRLISLLLETSSLYEEKAFVAGYLQEAMLTGPIEVPGVSASHVYRSASLRTSVGGDFYDVFAVDAEHIAVLVGDVSGHGLPAAATASLVKETIRTFTYEEMAPSLILSRTDQALQRRSLSGFATVFLGLVSRSTGRLTYSSAGHPPVLIRRASGEISVLNLGGVPLGAFSGNFYPTHRDRLAGGDIVLLYTDGIIEARREAELFGEERLAALLSGEGSSPGVVVRRIMNEAHAFSGGRFADDLVVVALTVQDLPDSQGSSPGREVKEVDV